MSDHLPATCCCHTFTPGCPIDCLQTVLSQAAFNALARAYVAPQGRSATVGDVMQLCRQGQLVDIQGWDRAVSGRSRRAWFSPTFVLGDPAAT
jgi:hypothetical protein